MTETQGNTAIVPPFLFSGLPLLLTLCVFTGMGSPGADGPGQMGTAIMMLSVTAICTLVAGIVIVAKLFLYAVSRDVNAQFLIGTFLSIGINIALWFIVMAAV